MRTENGVSRASSRSLLRTCILTAIGAFGAGIACTALVALPDGPLPADESATAGLAAPVFTLASVDNAAAGADDSKPPAQVACEDQVWPRFDPACLTRNGERPRQVRFVEPNRLAESTAPTGPQPVRGRQTLGIATPAASPPQVQAKSEAPVVTPPEQRRRAKRTRTSRQPGDVARNRGGSSPAEALDQFGMRRPVASAFGQPFGAPAMAYAPQPTRRAARPRVTQTSIQPQTSAYPRD
jgi:hypothetical protein